MKIIALVRSELQRLTSTGLARLALVALMTVPLLYGGLYLWANQDPYAKLDQVPAALVNDDAGTTVDGTVTNYGDEVTDEVVDGGDFDWHTVSAAEAAAGLRDGTYDFTFTIPRDFSADLTSATTDDPTRAQITLATNDTNSYLATTIAGQAGKTIRASVTEKVGKEAAAQLLVGLADIRTSIGDAADGADQLVGGVVSAEQGTDQLMTGASDASAGADELSAGASSAATGARALSDGTDELSAGATTLSSGLDQLETATSTLPDSAHQLATGADQVADGNEALAAGVAQAATASQAAIDAAPATQQAIGQQLVEYFVGQGQTPEEAAASAAEVASYFAPLSQSLSDANTQAQGLAAQVGQLATGARQVSDGAAALDAQAPALATGISDAAAGARQLDAGAASAATGADSLATGLGTLDTGAAGLSSGLHTLSDGTVSLREGLGALDTGATQLRDGLQTGLGEIPASTEQTRDAQSEAISDPVSVSDQAVTSAGTYGAGLAPFFISLAAWIGIYALFLIVRPFSKRAVTAVRAPGRVVVAGWAAPALLGVVQMLALFTIVRFALGFDVVHPWATIGLMALASVTFAAIIMTLNVLLGSVGQFLGLVLMVVQLVTAGGTFPWQTLPAPLAALHFVLPMSYATDGLRQLMYGGSTATAWGDAGVLALWGLGALLLSLLATRRMTRRRTLRDLRPSLIG
ncbi:YhgE/Pip family protein [Frigoribacterium endophyticum]|uniref:YhgE/Pip family protein n=1 Tax=Frigoribacterium endophyticum TaxID=1522176 RepID=UPI00141E6D28|nr:putative membrane protein [Frigoribacterium endophyticum]